MKIFIRCSTHISIGQFYASISLPLKKHERKFEFKRERAKFQNNYALCICGFSVGRMWSSKIQRLKYKRWLRSLED